MMNNKRAGRFGIKFIFGLTMGLMALSCSDRNPHFTLKIESVLKHESGASFRALHSLGEEVVWVSGSNGVFTRSYDGGKTWVSGVIVDSLDFRDIHAFDQQSAIVLSAGTPGLIFKTVDGGQTWDLKYSNYNPGVFFDALDFWDMDRGLAFGDEIDGYFLMIETTDGGETWTSLSNPPKAGSGEGGFAASGTNMITFNDSTIWIGTTLGRLVVSDDAGLSWMYCETPLASDVPTAGIFSIVFRDEKAIMVGGDFQLPGSIVRNSAIWSRTGGDWAIPSVPPGGYRSAVALVPKTKMAVTAGPNGIDFSLDNGMTWNQLDSTGFHAISFRQDMHSGWLSGSDGRIARILIESSNR